MAASSLATCATSWLIFLMALACSLLEVAGRSSSAVLARALTGSFRPSTLSSMWRMSCAKP